MATTRGRLWIGNILVHLCLAFGGLLIALPFFYAVSTSLKDMYEVFVIPMRWIPGVFHWENYLIPFQTRPLTRQFLNSVLVSGCVTALSVTTSTMAGYSFAKFTYRGRNTLFLGVLATLMVPIQVILVPLFVLVKNLGWLNTYAGLIIPAGTSAFGVFLMRQYFQSVPSEIIEAARIDGAGEMRIFLRVVLPLVRPALAALIIFIFMNNWNSFLWPLLVIRTENMMTLPLGIASFESVYSTNFPQLMAVSLAATAPVLLAFLLLQRQFIQGMALSGLKA